MEFKKIALFAFLCLPVHSQALGDEKEENIAPIEHSKDLTKEEKQAFEEHLEKKAQIHYANGDKTGLRTWNYKNKAMELTDNDIKRHLLDSSDSEKLSKNLKSLKKEQLKDLQTRLRQRIKENEDAIFTSKGLHEDLMALDKTIGDHLTKKYEEQSQPHTLEYYRQQFTQNIQEFSHIQDEINETQRKLAKAQTELGLKNLTLMQVKIRLLKTEDEDPKNTALIEATKGRIQNEEEQIKNIHKTIQEIKNNITDSKDRANLNQEDIGTALLEVLKATISQEIIKKLTLLARTIETTEFVGINAYTDTTNPQEVSDQKINAVKKTIEELSKIKPETPEITKYINFLKKEVENHFLNLQNETSAQYNDAQSKYSESKLEISKLEYEIQQAKRIFNVLGKESEIEKSKEFLKTSDQEISEYEDELKELRKKITPDQDRIATIQRQIIGLKQDKQTELTELGLDQKDIESYDALSTKEMQLTKFQQNLSRYTKKSTSLLSLQQYFVIQAKAMKS
jgi:hypothetical protein